MWGFPGFQSHGGTPKSSILIGCSLINHIGSYRLLSQVLESEETLCRPIFSFGMIVTVTSEHCARFVARLCIRSSVSPGGSTYADP